MMMDQLMYLSMRFGFTLCKYKDRSSDYLKNIIIKEAAMGKVMEVPDIALINTLNVDKKWDEDQNTS